MPNTLESTDNVVLSYSSSETNSTDKPSDTDKNDNKDGSNKELLNQDRTDSSRELLRREEITRKLLLTINTIDKLKSNLLQQMTRQQKEVDKLFQKDLDLTSKRTLTDLDHPYSTVRNPEKLAKRKALDAQEATQDQEEKRIKLEIAHEAEEQKAKREREKQIKYTELIAIYYFPNIKDLEKFNDKEELRSMYIETIKHLPKPVNIKKQAEKNKQIVASIYKNYETFLKTSNKYIIKELHNTVHVSKIGPIEIRADIWFTKKPEKEQTEENLSDYPIEINYTYHKSLDQEANKKAEVYIKTVIQISNAAIKEVSKKTKNRKYLDIKYKCGQLKI